MTQHHDGDQIDQFMDWGQTQVMEDKNGGWISYINNDKWSSSFMNVNSSGNNILRLFNRSRGDKKDHYQNYEQIYIIAWIELNKSVVKTKLE